MVNPPPTLALGSVQWGLHYGIANQTGQPSTDTVAHILKVARHADISVIDTARAYGSSEEVIGQVADTQWRIVTKCAPDLWTPGISTNDALTRLDTSLYQSNSALKRDVLDTVLLHRPEHRTCCNGALWHTLKAHQAQGRIRRLGISALTPQDAWEGLEDPSIDVMQVACSLLDQRLYRSGFFEQAAERGKEIHVRSIFLQGVAFLDIQADLPSSLMPLQSSLNHIHHVARQCNTQPAALWMMFARHLPATHLVIGCETVDQLEQNIAWAHSPNIPTHTFETLIADIGDLPDSALNPALW